MRPAGTPQASTPPVSGGLRQRLSVLSWMLFGATFLVQAAFPFTDGGTLALTIASVVFLVAAVIVNVVAVCGIRSAVWLVLVAGGGGLVAESVGVHTGFPFGSYSYTGLLGPEVLGVPMVVPLAWIMMAWPALAVARRLVGTSHPLVRALVGAAALTAWDVFLDPQMVDQGYWQWRDPSPSIPGVHGIPLTNFAGWFLVALLMMAVLDRLVDTATSDALPITIYLWTYFSSVVAHALFFGRPPVALVGGLLMGALAIPLAITLIRGARRARR
ncbi:carotenoid biosynthesis protein [Gordonia sp. NPDC003424]